MLLVSISSTTASTVMITSGRTSSSSPSTSSSTTSSSASAAWWSCSRLTKRAHVAMLLCKSVLTSHATTAASAAQWLTLARDGIKEASALVVEALRLRRRRRDRIQRILLCRRRSIETEPLFKLCVHCCKVKVIVWHGGGCGIRGTTRTVEYAAWRWRLLLMLLLGLWLLLLLTWASGGSCGSVWNCG